MKYNKFDVKLWSIWLQSTEFNSDGSKRSVELKIVNLQLVGESEFNMKRWEEIGTWQTGMKTDPNKTDPIPFSSHGGKNKPGGKGQKQESIAHFWVCKEVLKRTKEKN